MALSQNQVCRGRDTGTCMALLRTKPAGAGTKKQHGITFEHGLRGALVWYAESVQIDSVWRLPDKGPRPKQMQDDMTGLKTGAAAEGPEGAH